jgi:hypothetical protein
MKENLVLYKHEIEIVKAECHKEIEEIEKINKEAVA